jgi:uncharacterized membrane protein
MSEEERRDDLPEQPQEPESWTLEDAPEPVQPEEELGEQVTGAADSITAGLRDLESELTPPPPPEEPMEAPADMEPFVEPVELPPAEPAVPLVPPVRMGDTWTGDTAREKAAAFTPEGTDDDRLMSALAWFTMVILQLPIVSVIQLLSTNTANRPFQRHHAISSLLFYAGAFVYEIVALVVYIILGTITLGCGFACLWVIFFVPHALALFYAFQAYSGKRVRMPLLTDLGRGQGWL